MAALGEQSDLRNRGIPSALLFLSAEGGSPAQKGGSVMELQDPSWIMVRLHKCGPCRGSCSQLCTTLPFSTARRYSCQCSSSGYDIIWKGGRKILVGPGSQAWQPQQGRAGVAVRGLPCARAGGTTPQRCVSRGASPAECWEAGRLVDDRAEGQVGQTAAHTATSSGQSVKKGGKIPNHWRWETSWVSERQ